MYIFLNFSDNVGSRFSITIFRIKSLICLTFTEICDIIIKLSFEIVIVIIKNYICISIFDNFDILSLKLFNTT